MRGKMREGEGGDTRTQAQRCQHLAVAQMQVHVVCHPNHNLLLAWAQAARTRFAGPLRSALFHWARQCALDCTCGCHRSCQIHHINFVVFVNGVAVCTCGVTEVMALRVVTVLAAAVAVALATNGVDVSQPTSVDEFQCMVNNGCRLLLRCGSVGSVGSSSRSTHSKPAGFALPPQTTLPLCAAMNLSVSGKEHSEEAPAARLAGPYAGVLWSTVPRSTGPQLHQHRSERQPWHSFA